MLNLKRNTYAVAFSALLMCATPATAEDVRVAPDSPAFIGPPAPAPAPAALLVAPVAFDLKDAADASTSSHDEGLVSKGEETAAQPRYFTPELARSERQRQQKRAHRMMMLYFGLSAVDAAQTIYGVSSGKAKELNPIFGSHPSAAKMIGIKTAIHTLQYIGFRSLNHRNPKSAYKFAQFSAIFQGAVVGLNMRIFTK